MAGKYGGKASTVVDLIRDPIGEPSMFLECYSDHASEQRGEAPDCSVNVRHVASVRDYAPGYALLHLATHFGLPGVTNFIVKGTRASVVELIEGMIRRGRT